MHLEDPQVFCVHTQNPGLGIDHMGRVSFWSLSASAQDGVLKCRLLSSRGELKYSLRVGERLVCSQNQRSNNGLSTKGGFRSRYDDAKYCIFADDNMKIPTVISTVPLLVFDLSKYQDPTSSLVGRIFRHYVSTEPAHTRFLHKHCLSLDERVDGHLEDFKASSDFLCYTARGWSVTPGSRT